MTYFSGAYFAYDDCIFLPPKSPTCRVFHEYQGLLLILEDLNFDIARL